MQEIRKENSRSTQGLASPILCAGKKGDCAVEDQTIIRLFEANARAFPVAYFAFTVVDAKPFIAFPTVDLAGVIMRTYVFTERERRIIQGFLSRRIGITDRDLSKIRSRLKLFERLKNDVFLYLELWDTVLLETGESETTASA